jgi:hypothetical protein
MIRTDDERETTGLGDTKRTLRTMGTQKGYTARRAASNCVFAQKPGFLVQLWSGATRGAGSMFREAGLL